jgi:CRP-like cAMP-binding protein
MTVIVKDEAARPWLESPLLAGVETRARRAIARHLVGERVEPGVTLLRQGVANLRLWFVVEGGVAIERKRPDGKVDLITSLSGPALFGTTTFFGSTAPSMTIRATSALTVWTLDHAGHEALRRDDPSAAESLALAVVRVVSERFDLLDQKLGEFIAEHAQDHPKATELAEFRSRLFDDPAP